MIAAILQQPGEAIGVQAGLADDLGRLADAAAAPQVDLEQPVLGGDEALGEEEVVGILGVDVGHAPAVAQHLDRLLQAGHLDLPLQLGEDGARLRAERLRRFRDDGRHAHFREQVGPAAGHRQQVSCHDLQVLHQLSPLLSVVAA